MSRIVIEDVTVSAYRIPTDAPESDGTLEWDATTVVVTEVTAGGVTGLGYGYADVAAAHFIQGALSPVVRGLPALHIGAAGQAMLTASRNQGRQGLTAMAISAVDAALWDLKGQLLDSPVADLLGRVHEGVPLYGSGGFTSYSHDQLVKQLGGWADTGFPAVKMKIGRDPGSDRSRVEQAREAIGPDVNLFVDANGALTRKQALAFAEDVAPLRVGWLEEPVSSDDLAGLRLLRDRVPAPMAVSAGEYGFDAPYFRRMLEAGAVDVLQADATRCGGISGFLSIAALAEAHETPLSAHCAPALHIHACCATPQILHMEWFHDHVRIERMLFDGTSQPQDGRLRPPDAPGLGLALNAEAAARFRIL